MKPRNKTAISPLMKKGHVHKSKKDYDRKLEKDKLREEIKASEK